MWWEKRLRADILSSFLKHFRQTDRECFSHVCLIHLLDSLILKTDTCTSTLDTNQHVEKQLRTTAFWIWSADANIHTFTHAVILPNGGDMNNIISRARGFCQIQHVESLVQHKIFSMWRMWLLEQNIMELLSITFTCLIYPPLKLYIKMVLYLFIVTREGSLSNALNFWFNGLNLCHFVILSAIIFNDHFHFIVKHYIVII